MGTENYPGFRATSGTMDQDMAPTVPPECDIISMEKCLHFSLIPAVLIVGVLSFLQRRAQKHVVDQRLPFLQGRFGIVVPMDAMSFSNRWSYGFAFGAISYSVLELLFENHMSKLFPVWAKAIAYLIGSFEVGLAYFPFFACLSTPFRKTGAVMGILYSLCWIAVVSSDWYFCPSGVVWGQYQNLIYQWPWMLSLIFLLVRFILRLVKAVRKPWAEEIEDSEEIMHSHQMEHVKRLLRETATYSKSLNWFQRHVYEWDPCFKFPNRLIGTAIISLLALYTLTLSDLGADTLAVNFIGNFIDIFPDTLQADLIEFLDVFKMCWRVTLALASLNSVVYICHVLVCYRKQMKRLWKGQKDFLPKKLQNSSSAVSVASIAKYCGWQIAFTLWGFVIVRVVQFLIAMVFSYLVILPIKHGQWMQQLERLGLPVVTFVLIFGLLKLQEFHSSSRYDDDIEGSAWPSTSVYLLMLLNSNLRHSFLDKLSESLDLRLKAFSCFNYFFFFYNVVMGITSCFIRIMTSFVLGTWLVSRIDRTIMQKGYETLDKGYHTWVGMIYTDHYHNNPVMVCFCHLLVSHIQHIQQGSYYSIQYNISCDTANNRVRKRWRLFYTLLKNPHLIPLRKHHLSASVPLKLASSPQADIVVKAWLLGSQC